MSGLSKGLGKVEVTIKWDPSPLGESDHDLDIVAATYSDEDPYGRPVYLVHFGSRSPDGTIILSRDSRDGQGLGDDEVMTLEFDRLASRYVRVVVGVAIQQSGGRRTFGEIARASFRIAEGYTELARDDFATVSGARAANVAVFTRDDSGGWQFRKDVRGFDADPDEFAERMGSEGP